jgi:integrase
MDADSILVSMAMLNKIAAGETYHAVAAQYGVTRSTIERRIKMMALRLYREVGIDGINEEGLAFACRLRACRSALVAAIARYETRRSQEKRDDRILTDKDIQLGVYRTRSRSPCPQRDVALLYVLLTTGARPLELARLEVRDYLHADGQIREESVLRADVAVNRKSRPLLFTNARANDSIDGYLAERLRKGFGVTGNSDFRGLEPHSRLFLSEAGAPFEIVSYGAQGQRRFLCRGILDTYHKIFRRIGIPGVSALSVRRTVAVRLFRQGVKEAQIGKILGISEKKSVRDLLPKRDAHLPSVVRELV